MNSTEDRDDANNHESEDSGAFAMSDKKDTGDLNSYKGFSEAPLSSGLDKHGYRMKIKTSKRSFGSQIDDKSGLGLESPLEASGVDFWRPLECCLFLAAQTQNARYIPKYIISDCCVRNRLSFLFEFVRPCQRLCFL